MNYIELTIIILGWLIGNIIFNNFEKHVPRAKRIFKLAIILILIYIIDLFFGRIPVYSILALMLAGMIYLHFYFFKKKGINPIIAEPHEKYMKIIRKMKGK